MVASLMWITTGRFWLHAEHNTATKPSSRVDRYINQTLLGSHLQQQECGQCPNYPMSKQERKEV